jgi:uncharacterized delta-60 repeat protein
MKLNLTILFIGLFCSSLLFAQNQGSLDPSFGNNGITLSNPDSTSNYGTVDAFLADDGTFVTVGNYGSWPNYKTLVTKYDVNGNPTATLIDSSNGGTVFIYGVVKQTTGKIVVIGGDNSSGYFFAKRYNSDLSTDTSFGTGGYFVDSVAGSAQTVAIQADDKILLGGNTLISGNNWELTLIRITADGTLDNSFSGDGVIQQNLGSFNDAVTHIEVFEDGRIMIGCRYGNNPTSGSPMNLFYINENGVIDNDFDRGFLVPGATFNLEPALKEYPVDIEKTSDGNFLILARYYDPSGGAYSDKLILVDSMANYVTSFNSVGYKDIDTENAIGAVIMPNNKIKVLGQSTWNNMGTIHSYDLSGQLDSTWGNNGMIDVDMGSGPNFVGPTKLLLQNDGKLVVAARAVVAWNSGGLEKYYDGMARYLTSTSLGVVNPQLSIKETLIYPNPVVGQQLSLEYELMEDAEVQILLTGLDGREYGSLYNQLQQEGKQQLDIRLPESLNSGMYLLGIKVGAQYLSLQFTIAK